MRQPILIDPIGYTPITVPRAGTGQPTSMTLDNPGFATLVLLVGATILICLGMWDWLRTKRR